MQPKPSKILYHRFQMLPSVITSLYITVIVQSILAPHLNVSFQLLDYHSLLPFVPPTAVPYAGGKSVITRPPCVVVEVFVCCVVGTAVPGNVAPWLTVGGY